MNRTDVVDLQIIAHFKNMRHNVHVAHDDATWESLTSSVPVDVVGETIYGWSAPFRDDASDTKEGLLVYPERIMKISEHLDDEHFGCFIDVVEFRLNLMFAAVGSEQFYAVDDVLGDESSDSLNLFNNVRLRALDLVQ